MSDNVTFTAADLDAAKNAILKNPGLTEMRIGDRLYKFAPWQDQQARIAYIQRHIEGGNAGGVRYASSSKGV